MSISLWMEWTTSGIYINFLRDEYEYEIFICVLARVSLLMNLKVRLRRFCEINLGI